MTKSEAKAQLRDIKRTIRKLKAEIPEDKKRLLKLLGPYWELQRLIRAKKRQVKDLQIQAVQLRPYIHAAPSVVSITADVLGDRPRCHLCHRRIRKYYREKHSPQGERRVRCLTCHKANPESGFNWCQYRTVQEL